MKKSKTYWGDRQEQWINNQNKKDEKFAAKLEKQYKKTSMELESEIAGYFQTYGKDNVIEFREMMQGLSKSERDMLFQRMEEFAEEFPQFEHLMPVRESIYKLNRMQGLHYSTQMQLLELGAIEQKEFEKYLTNVYGEQYKNMLDELGLGSQFLSLDSKLIQDTIFTKWVNDENFSGRIWDNKNKLLNHLLTRFRDGLARGDDYRTLAAEIQERLSVGAFDAKRLVWTESSFVLNQAHTHPYTDMGVEEYEINAIMDSRTSKICRDLDGSVFRFDEMVVGLNFPPFHPWCRTTFIGVMGEEGEEGSSKLDDEVNIGAINDAHEDIFNQFPESDEMKEQFKEILKGMDSDDLLVYEELSKFVRGNDYNYKGGAHYMPSNRKVSMNLKHNAWEKKMGIPNEFAFGTKIHEEFHQLDHLFAYTDLVKDSEGNAYSWTRLTSTETETGKVMYDAINSDILNFVNKAIDYTNDKNGTKAKHLKSLGRISADAKRSVNAYLKDNHSTEKEKAQISMFTDALGGATGGRISPHGMGYWGHSNQYYKDRGDNVAGLEAWAEYGAYKFVYDDETKGIINELMPETIKANDSVYKKVIEHVKKNGLEYLTRK